MGLITRINGTGASSLISASWFNDFKDLLTGRMVDQPVTIKNTITTQVFYAPPATPATATLSTLSTSVNSGLALGLYQYAYSWVNSDGGESALGPICSVTTTFPLRQSILLSGIDPGPTDAAFINLYRSRVGGGPLFFLAHISRTTTPIFADIAADSSLGHPASLSTSYGGALLLKDAGGNINGIVHQESNGTLALNGTSQIRFEITGGNTLSGTNRVDMAFIDGRGLHVDGGGGALFINEGFTGSFVSYLVVGSNFGVKNGSGVKLFEAKNNGNLIIGGTQYQTSASSVGTASGQSFDNFDVAELFACDAPYPSGTVVCPSTNNLLSTCTHENCPCALIVSSLPGFLLGASEDPNMLPMAMAGRINVNTSSQVQARDLVVSDGQGGVRVKQRSEQGYVIGFALNAAQNGQVGIFLRNMVV